MSNQICIIQLLRTGDLIQTIQAMEHYKQSHPELDFTLVARKKFAEPVMFLLNQYFSKIILLDTKALDKNSLQNSQAILIENLKELRSMKFDIAINLSFSKASEWLTSLVQAKNKLGLKRNTRGEIVIDDTWSQYVFATVMNGSLNPFNLVDIFSFMIGGQTPQKSKTRQKSNRYIFIHPFSSHERKRWQPKVWIDVIQNLMTSIPGYDFFIVGSEAESAQASQIISAFSQTQNSGKIYNLAGEPLEEVFDTLKTAACFIGHDSMVGHLASLANVPTVTISLGMVRPSETTPYGKSALNLSPKISCFPCQVSTSCENTACHKEITPNAVSAYVKALLNNEISVEFIERQSKALACIGYYPDQNSEVQVLKKYSSGHTLEDAFKGFYTLTWAYYFKGIALNGDFPKMNERDLAELKNYSLGVQNLFELYSYAQKFTAVTIKELQAGKVSPEKHKSQMAQLTEVDQLAQINKSTYPLLAPIIDYFHVQRMNVQGNTLEEMLGNILLAHQDATHLVSVLYDLMEKTLLNANIPLDNTTKNV